MNFKELEKIIKADGWIHVKTKASHHHYRHPIKSGKVTIPNHPGDIDIRIVQSVLKQAKLK